MSNTIQKLAEEKAAPEILYFQCIPFEGPPSAPTGITGLPPARYGVYRSRQSGLYLGETRDPRFGHVFIAHPSKEYVKKWVADRYQAASKEEMKR